MELLPWRTLHVASSSAALLIVIGLRSIMHFKFTRLVATYADQAMVRKPYYHKYLLGSISTAICTAWCTINTSAKKKKTYVCYSRWAISPACRDAASCIGSISLIIAFVACDGHIFFPWLAAALPSDHCSYRWVPDRGLPLARRGSWRTISPN
jgi:hypothetical protein